MKYYPEACGRDSTGLRLVCFANQVMIQRESSCHAFLFLGSCSRSSLLLVSSFFKGGLPTPLSPSPQSPGWLTLQQCIEGTWGRQVGGYGDVVLAGGLHLDMHWAVCVTSETAHLAGREGHICQAAKAVIPENQGVALSNRDIMVLLLELGMFMPWFCMFHFSFCSDTFPCLQHLLGHNSICWYSTAGRQPLSLESSFPNSVEWRCPPHPPGFLWAMWGSALLLWANTHSLRGRWWCPRWR